MKYDMDSIIGCAFNYPRKFVLWTQKVKEGDKAAWYWEESYHDTNPSPIVWSCDNGNLVIDFMGAKGRYKPLKSDHRFRKGLLCIAEALDDYDRSKILYGLCLDSDLKPDFFISKKETLDYLVKTLFVLKIIPQEIIRDKINEIGWNPFIPNDKGEMKCLKTTEGQGTGK